MLDSYCREVETYLCQKNEGHLIRIVGPAFERVCDWAARGVPLKIAFRGIDRYCERHYAKGGRRRPVRIEFCEADILDAFDDWRRAVGVAGASEPDERTAEPGGRKGGLAAHIERALGRLGSIDTAREYSAEFRGLIDAAVRQLETYTADARGARGENRARIVSALAALDRELMTAGAKEIDAARARELQREAEAELAPFGARMAPDARETALEAAFRRLVREALGLPTLSYE